MQLIKEVHSGGLTAHVDYKKTIEQLKNCLFWELLRKDVYHFIKCCSIFQNYKGSTQNTRLYTPFPIPNFI